MKICNVEALRFFLEANSWEPIFPRKIVFLFGAKEYEGKIIGINPDYDRARVEFEVDGKVRRLMVSQFDIVRVR